MQITLKQNHNNNFSCMEDRMIDDVPHRVCITIYNREGTRYAVLADLVNLNTRKKNVLRTNKVFDTPEDALIKLNEKTGWTISINRGGH